MQPTGNIQEPRASGASDDSGDPGHGGDGSDGRSDRTSGRALAVLVVLVTTGVFLQHPGKIAHDTRLDLLLDPWGFMSRTWHLWEPLGDMGRVQNQAVGYLFPMGPFFGLMHSLGVPPWVAERAWISLLLGLALCGMAKLADELDVGTPISRLVGATAYALSPFFVARAGTLSAFVMGAALLPWVLVPLVRGARGGSTRRAACLSGIAVLCIGGVNGTVTAAVLVAPALYLLTRERGPRRASLMRWWAAAVVLATSWWSMPLLFQARYGINFLALTEQTKTTTAFTPPIEVIRGTADWLSYFHLHGAFIPAGFMLAYDAVAIAATSLVAAAGLYGLARRGLREHRFLVATFAIGTAIVGIGFGGLLGNPFALPIDHLLDSRLPALRTVYKFEPLVALSLALALMHTVAVAGRRIRERAPDVDRFAPVAVATFVVVLVAALPLFTDDLMNDHPFTRVPAWWTQAEQSLDNVPGRTLVVPGLPFSDSTWGYTSEEPLEWSNHSFATRSIVPLGSTGATKYLDAIEAAIERGGDPGLPAFLAAGGFSTVLARNDANWQKYGAPSPQTVNHALLASGLTPLNSFGPPIPLSGEAGVSQLPLGQITTYSVPGAVLAQSYPFADAAVLSGDPGTPMVLEQLGLGGRALTLASDLRPGQPLPPYWIDSDGNQRVAVQFGLNRDNSSYVLSANDASPNEQSVDQPVAEGLLAGPTRQDQVAVVKLTPATAGYPGSKLSDQTVAVRQGILRVSASSSGSWLVDTPEISPAKALDGDPDTAWTAGPANGSSEGQWLQVELNQPVDVDHVDVRLLEDGPWRPAVHAMRVITANGTRITSVKPDQSLQRLQVAPGRTRWIRVSFESVTDQERYSAGAGIRELHIPGVEVRQWLQLPSQLLHAFAGSSANPPAYVFQRSQANPHSLLRQDPETSMARLFTTPKAQAVAVNATASAEPGPALLKLVDDTPTFAISASSTLGDLPDFAPRNLVDSDAKSIWVAGALVSTDADSVPSTNSDLSVAPKAVDLHPTVTMSWKGERKLTELDVRPAAGYSTPTEVRIVAGGTTRTARVGTDGVVTFPAITTDHVVISFPRVAVRSATDPLGNEVARPLALSALEFPLLLDLQPTALDPHQPLHVACSEGPILRVDGQIRHFSVSTTMGGLVSMQPVEATECGTGLIELPAGRNQLTTATGSSPFNLAALALADPRMLDAKLATPRSVTVSHWASTRRTVQIGAGAQAYLVVNENANKGWHATLDGHELTAATIDGWRQGFIVPAGRGGTITLTFGPATAYQSTIVLGLLLALLLVGLTFVPARLATDQPAVGEGRWSTGLAVAAAAVAGVLVGGVAALLLVPLWAVRRRWPDTLAPIASIAFVVAGGYLALTQHSRRSVWQGAFSYPANLLALVAFMAVVVTLVPRRRD